MNLTAPLLTFGILISLAVPSPAQKKRTHTDPGKMEPYWIAIVPKDGAPPSSRPIPGARHSVFLPVFRNQNAAAVTPYSEDQFQKLRIGWPGFYEKAQNAAELWMREVIPTFRLDEKTGEPVYGAIHVEHPLTSGLLLAPSFPKLFSEALGTKDLVAVVPNQHSIYVFPAKKTTVAAFGDLVASTYGAALEDGTAASPELFFIGDPERGIHVVGGFDGRTEPPAEEPPAPDTKPSPESAPTPKS